MSEFSDWFKDTFKKCYCEHGNLIDEQRFAEIVQLVLDNEADDESRSIFEQKIKSCVKSNFTFEKEKKIKDFQLMVVEQTKNLKLHLNVGRMLE